jgi:hypothetical protein
MMVNIFAGKAKAIFRVKLNQIKIKKNSPKSEI